MIVSNEVAPSQQVKTNDWRSELGDLDRDRILYGFFQEARGDLPGATATTRLKAWEKLAYYMGIEPEAVIDDAEPPEIEVEYI